MKLLIPLLLLSLSLPLFAETKKTEEKQPNIVLIISDDGGWADFGFNNCPDFKTPTLDKLAAQGTIFRNGYVTASVCSPSRAGILSGRSQSRFGHELNLPMGDQSTTGFPLKEKTLADRLKSLGYTTGAFGKWHLGSAPEFRPAKRGFDYSYIFLKGSRAYMPEKNVKDNETTMRINDKPELLTEYLTDAISKQTAQYIEKEKNNPKPLFLYVAYNCPHSPLQAKPGYTDKFPNLKGHRQTLAAMQTSLDEGVGSIVDALKKTGRWENTIFWFINDNGGATYGKFNNGGLRNNKGSLYEGGIKVAFFAHFPKNMDTPKLFDSPISSLDIAATSLTAAGAQKKDLDKLEGIDIRPFLINKQDNKKSTADRPLFWRQNNVGAVQHKQWKLILLDGKGTQLYNLKNDPFEKSNLIDKELEKATALDSLYQTWNKENIAPLWRANPNAYNEKLYGKNAPWERKNNKEKKSSTAEEE